VLSMHWIVSVWHKFELNLMISYRLAVDYVMADFLALAMIYFRAFALFIRAFC
jgi:hypothetical protein